MTSSPDLQDAIRERALLIYRERGKHPGADLDNWLMAEREIKAALSLFIAFDESAESQTGERRDRLNYDDFMAFRKFLDQTPRRPPLSNVSQPLTYFAAPGFRRTAEGTWGPGAVEMLNAASSAIAVLVSAGGAKMLIDLIKAWIAERTGRKIRIAANGVEVEITGATSKGDINRAVDLLERLAATPKPGTVETSRTPSKDTKE